MIPAAVRRRRADIEAQATPSAPTPAPASVAETPPAPDAPALDENRFAVQADPAPQDSPSPSPSPSPAPAPADDANNATWEQRFRSLDGMLRSLKLRNQSLEEQVRALEAARAAGGSTTPASTPADADEDIVVALNEGELTAAERQQFEKSLPVIRKVVAEMVKAAVEPALRKIHAAARDARRQSTDVQAALADTLTHSFQDRLLTAIPDIEALSDTPEFQAYVNRTIPYSGGERVKTRLHAAYTAQDVRTIQAIVDEFRKERGAEAPAADPKLLEYPSGSGQPRTPRSRAPQQKPVLAWSKLREAQQQRLKGQITKAEFDRIRQLYDDAAKEGRIDYQK